MSQHNAPKEVIFYVTRDIERALGMDPQASYQIITNTTGYARDIQKRFPEHVHLIEDTTSDHLFDTWELLEHPRTKEIIDRVVTHDGNNHTSPAILVFKNTVRIEEICARQKWHLLNPSAHLAETIENKMTQIEYLGELADLFLPEHTLVPAKEIIWNKKPLIIQWAHSHTGEGTILVNSPGELMPLQQKFPERIARVSTYIHGPSFTMNIAVSDTQIFLGNVSYQITGIPPFTENPFSTIGNDWSLTHSLLDESELTQLEVMATQIAHKLQADGWKGLFGIDIIRDDERNTLNLIEINARQPASAVYESILEHTNRTQGMQGMTIFEAHLRALTGVTTSAGGEIIHINDGAQIIQRVTRLTESVSPKQITELHQEGCNTIIYEYNAENADLLRIQCPMGIMETHGRFNIRGKKIADIMKVA